LRGYWTDLSHTELTARVNGMLIQRQDLANSLREKIMKRHLTSTPAVMILLEVTLLLELLASAP